MNKKLHQRIKRLFNRRSSKSRVDSDTIPKSNQRYDNLFLLSNDGKKSKLGTKIKYIQQDLAEIKRILSKKEHDYYGRYQQATEPVTNVSFTISNKKHGEVSNIIDKTSTTISVLPQLEYSTKEKQSLKINTQDDKSHYFLFAFILLIIGIIICIIYWKKRQRRIQSFSFENGSKKSKISPTYDSSDSDDDDTINMHDTTEVSIIKDEAATNLVTKTRYSKR
ncbi:unnamed protein product [Rotaria socialis]|uniref:Uncharacterized protein n=1 Tax=Rotaria socialis TaxID=392032 RepID=A0A817XQC5_9BILA|nr:unnamed protein product [Rotaria socialis]CAF4727037.1 unnamed protein product [Rotaria socialis]